MLIFVVFNRELAKYDQLKNSCLKFAPKYFAQYSNKNSIKLRAWNN